MTICTLDQLRELTAIQAEDDALWDIHPRSIETAYIQQGLRFITNAIEGTWTFEETKAALEDLRS
jgi:hypothetical protein